MTPLLSLSSLGILLLATQSLALAAPLDAYADSGRIEVTGDYRYAFHEPETAAEAKQTACTEALHQAISTSAPVREQMIGIVDSTLFRNLVHQLATKHVTEQQILQQSEKGRTVYCKIKALFQASDVERVFLTQTAGGSEPGLDQNRALKILSVREDADGTVIIVYKALKRLDWLGTAYQGSLRESADVMVDFYDEQGALLRSTRYPARRTAGGDDVMNPGEVGTLKIAKPLNTKTYRVWLVK
ncbi:MAG: hypothetical protein KF814_05665 [Nitrospiraceae bacterium]|nr:hypothetical protein [Nitrospiraceae bacterium]